MIAIDFQGGSHGNYLEFVCNYILAKIPCQFSNPFDKFGSSHNKTYLKKPLFKCGHYNFPVTSKKFIDSKIISIQIDYDDLLPLCCISFSRALHSNTNIVDNLEINTYNKLNNTSYQKTLQKLLQHYFSAKHLVSGYNKIKSQEWPEIKNLQEFYNLPKYIQEECENYHGMELLELSEDHPNCPRYILREFFKLGFKFPEQHGFIREQNKVRYDKSNDVFFFPFEAFYDLEKFVFQVQRIADWCDLTDYNLDILSNLHNEFLIRQPYKDAKSYCDTIIAKIQNQEDFEIEDLNLFYESYISAKIELLYNITLPFKMPLFFKHSSNLYKYLL